MHRLNVIYARDVQIDIDAIVDKGTFVSFPCWQFPYEILSSLWEDVSRQYLYVLNANRFPFTFM